MRAILPSTLWRHLTKLPTLPEAVSSVISPSTRVGVEDEVLLQLTSGTCKGLQKVIR